MIGICLCGLLALAGAGGPVFEAIPTGRNAKPIRGEILNFNGTSIVIKTITGEVLSLPVVSLRQVGVSVPPYPNGPMLISALGDRISGELVGGDDEAVWFRPQSIDGEALLKVAYGACSVIWLSPMPPDSPLRPADYPWRGSDSVDTLLFRNGDIKRGTLIRFTDDRKVVCQLPGQTPKAEYSLHQLAAVSFNPTLSRVRTNKESYISLILRDGSRILLKPQSIDKGFVAGRMQIGPSIRVSLEKIVGWDVVHGDVVRLTDIRAAEAYTCDYFGRRIVTQSDQYYLREMLELPTTQEVSTFDFGISVTPRTAIIYSLPPGYSRFDVQVGLDASSRQGSANVEILLDDQKVMGKFLSPGKSYALRIPLDRAKKISLIADFGSSGPVGAMVNWGNPILVK